MEGDEGRLEGRREMEENGGRWKGDWREMKGDERRLKAMEGDWRELGCN